MNHAAGYRACFANLNFMAHAGEMVCRGQAARPGTDNQNFPASIFRRLLELPTLLECEIAKESFDGMNADGAVGEGAIAYVFAWVIANASVN
jgi:hypothetical protein